MRRFNFSKPALTALTSRPRAFGPLGSECPVTRCAFLARHQSSGSVAAVTPFPEHQPFDSHTLSAPELRQALARSPSCLASQSQKEKRRGSSYIQPRKRSHSHYEPAALLATATRIRHRASTDISPEDLKTGQFIAQSRDPRLPAVTALMMLYCTPDLHPRISALLPTDGEWDLRFSKLESQGFRREDVIDWVRILSSQSQDEQIRRFLAGSCLRPTFLLNYILNNQHHPNSRLLSPDLLYGLIDYCKRWYTDGQIALGEEGPTTSSSARQCEAPVLNGIVKRLLSHSRRIRPEAMIDVAELAVTYLRNEVAANQSINAQKYKTLCLVFNHTLQQLCIRPQLSPYISYHFSWQSIMSLLAFSSGLASPLVVERQTYQSIRRVLLSIRKSDAERDTSTTLKQTWPPYRILRNGVEEALPLDEYYSRTVKAGAMMREAGYAQTLLDLAIDVLGGLAPDGSPTIQSRSYVPGGGHSAHAVWAARVRATRNAEEAWQAFCHPPEPLLKPDAEVYWQMISKALQRPAQTDHRNFPGDGRESFAYYDFGLSDFEKSRRKPPNVSTLVEWMLDSGIPLVGRCLNTLIRLAYSPEDAARHINASSLREDERKEFLKILIGTGEEELLLRVIQGAPRSTTHAVLHFCCGMQAQMPANRRTDDLSQINSADVRWIRKAMRLAEVAWIHTGDRSPAPFESILRTLAKPGIILTTESPQANSAQIIMLAGRVMKQAEEHFGLTCTMFDQFAQSIQKAMEAWITAWLDKVANGAEGGSADRALLSLYSGVPSPSPLPSREQPVFHDWPSEVPALHAELVKQAILKVHSTWLAVQTTSSTSRILNNRSGSTQPLPVRACSVNNYMRTLAFLGNFAGMADLTQWTARNYPRLASRGESGDDVYLSRALCAFRAFAEPMLNEGAISPLKGGFELGQHRQHQHQLRLCWPADEEVGEYVRSDKRGSAKNLQTLLWLLRQRNGGGGGDGALRTRVLGQAPPQTVWDAAREGLRARSAPMEGQAWDLRICF